MATQAPRPDEAARRAFWAKSLDAAWDFMQTLYRLPLEECGEEMVSLPAVCRDARLDVTFSTRPHGAAGVPRVFHLRRGLVEPFLGAARAASDRGWVLHVEDAFRTPAMQEGLWRQESIFRAVLDRTRWELGGALPDEQLLYRRLAAVLAACPRIGGHLSGAAVDVSVRRRDDGRELPRGGPYIEMSEVTPMGSPFISPQEQANRRAITEVFERLGFAAYPYEFWHYSRGDPQEAALHRTGKPARYGPVTFDPADGKVTPVPDAARSFVPPEEVRKLMTKVLAQA